jgi:hypothetical protein
MFNASFLTMVMTPCHFHFDFLHPSLVQVNHYDCVKIKLASSNVSLFIYLTQELTFEPQNLQNSSSFSLKWE